MATVQHSSLTDPDLHEPKGISSAVSNTVYTANGSGSGTFIPVNRFPGTGWGRYTNANYTGVTYLNITTSAQVLPFDTNADVTQLPIALNGTTTSLMNLSTETLQFVSAGDMHSITLSFLIVNTTGSPNHIDLTLYGSSDGTTYSTILGETTVPVLKSANQFVNASSLFPVTSDMATYGARIELKTDIGSLNIKDINLITTRVHKAR